jgi:[ribosomal protein S5]-alanine N-acetyltransferase
MPERVYLESPSLRRQTEFLALALRSRQFHSPWVKPPTTEAEFATYLRNCRKQSSQSFFICTKGSRRLVGVVNIAQIVRGLFQSAYIGFYVFEPMSRRGHMADGLHLVLDDTFRQLKLHRLEANIQPANCESLQFVKKLGFTREGYSPKYLKIRGKWRDHERWAILAEDWRQRRRSFASGWRKPTRTDRFHSLRGQKKTMRI